MKTVKEVSELSGISVRTLHYYDEIGLLIPTQCTEAGYRLYDDKAIERLKQILFFREFDMPLKEIRSILENPDFDQNQILRMQKVMLEKKRDRLNSLIDNIDRMLKGVNDMNFEVFSKEDIEELCQTMLGNMDEKSRKMLVEPYGDEEGFRHHYLEQAGTGQTQKNFKKVVEWYGDKESAMKAGTNPENPQIFSSYQNRLSDIMKRIAQKKGTDASSMEVKLLMGEYDFVAKQLYQMEDVSKMMLEMADLYQNDEQMITAQDELYGEGTTVYLGEAIRAFYQK